MFNRNKVTSIRFRYIQSESYFILFYSTKIFCVLQLCYQPHDCNCFQQKFIQFYLFYRLCFYFVRFKRNTVCFKYFLNHNSSRSVSIFVNGPNALRVLADLNIFPVYSINCHRCTHQQPPTSPQQVHCHQSGSNTWPNLIFIIFITDTRMHAHISISELKHIIRD